MRLLTVVLFVSLSAATDLSGTPWCRPGVCTTDLKCIGRSVDPDPDPDNFIHFGSGFQTLTTTENRWLNMDLTLLMLRELLALILHCSQPWSQEQEANCPEACRRWPHYCYYAIAAENGVPGTCSLPPYPRVGSYSITDIELAGPLADFTLVYSCPPGYTLHGQHPRCVNGGWTAAFPNCMKETKCLLPSEPSVTYTCDSGKCPERVGSGQRVLPECGPGFMREELRPMYCIDGSWNYEAKCRIECGTISSQTIRLRKRNTVRASDEAPWHVSVYRKTDTPVQQICEASLVSAAVIISAAHCFWNEIEKRTSPAGNYAVAAGKNYRPWNWKDDGQKSDVSDIQVPPHFRGAGNSFQSDISLVTLKTSMVLNAHVRPVCVDFSFLLDEEQLQPGNLGKVAAWNMTPTLKVVEMSYVAVDQCYTNLPADFSSYITSDKICAKPVNGTALCAGDSGGGLVFPSTDRGVQRWYLRGVVSTAPPSRDGDSCTLGYTAFTHLLKHDAFITKLMNTRA